MVHKTCPSATWDVHKEKVVLRFFGILDQPRHDCMYLCICAYASLVALLLEKLKLLIQRCCGGLERFTTRILDSPSFLNSFYNRQHHLPWRDNNETSCRLCTSESISEVTPTSQVATVRTVAIAAAVMTLRLHNEFSRVWYSRSVVAPAQSTTSSDWRNVLSMRTLNFQTIVGLRSG